jgi:hypothetical protein
VSHIRLALATLAVLAAAPTLAQAQPPAPAAGAAPAARPAGPPPPKRPGLLFKADWTNPTGEEVALPANGGMANPDIELKVYGVGAVMRVTGKDGDENNPSHAFSGECKSSCAIAFQRRKGMADLTGLARVSVNTKMSGFHKVYPIVKLAGGDWYVGDAPQGASIRDWLVSEFNPADLRWTKLDIANVVTKGNPVDKIDLSKVDEIGFADLMPGSGHGPGGWFDLGKVEVYGKLVAR